ncbi:MAG TPA: hypothetical protein VJ862_02580 [Rhodanobacteraceae bacterium]|nr:hypothetical protein [Rhodanobacteraceae bacterium]
MTDEARNTALAVTDARTFPVIAKPHPLQSDTVVAYMREGQTLREALGDNTAYSLTVEVGGIEVPEHMWDRVRPRAGVPVHVRVYPQGGNGGKWLRTILLVVVMIAAVAVTYGAAAGLFGAGTLAAGSMSAALAGAAIGIVGSLVVNALIPPPTPKGLNGGASNPFQQLNSITGTSNQANPYGVIPCVVGKMRF